jgi:hypothetical protein
MKKQLLTIMAMGAMSSTFAQLPVSTVPSNKNVVLEEFTGVYCGYCPDGHAKATTLYNSNPVRVVLINIHQGGYATVNSGEPDFTTPEGNAIGTMTGMLIAGYPAGDVNRTVMAGSQTAGGMAENRGNWTANANTIMTQAAYCNVALQGTVDATTRVLTIQAAVYYTANSPASTNMLNLVLMEDDVPGPQHDYGNYNPTNWNPDGTYKHNHVLRHMLTGNFGVSIPVTTAGTTYTTTATYTIPATYGAIGKTTQALLGRMNIAAFVTETNTLTINAAHGPLVITNIPNTLDAGVTNLTATDGKMGNDAAVCAAKLNANFKFVNYGSTTITQAVFSYNANGSGASTYTWTGSLPPLTESQTINLPTLSFAPVASNTLNINVVSVNGSTDQNPANNTWVKTGIPLTAVVANTLAMQMDFTQDQYGSEDKWTLYDEVAGTTISTDGPWADLSTPGQLLHTKTFTTTSNTCYKLVVTDAYGDGTYSSTVTACGSYYLKSGATTIISNPNGNYGYGENKWYKTANITGIAAPQMHISSMSMYPNPATSSTNIKFEMSQNENVNIIVVNALGQSVYNESLSLNSGEQTINLNTENWASGLYNVSVSSPSGSTKQKLTISK